MDPAYVHGYSPREAQRLLDQAHTLTDLLHYDTAYPEGSRVLEAGCGVGAQTVTLVRNSPGAQITSVDISGESLREAERRVSAAGGGNVRFMQADLLALPFEPESFDHVFLCFVLEHVPEPLALLQALLKVMKPGGSVTAIEGDHGSTFFHPESAFARRAIQCLVELQARGGGDALIGRRLFPLFQAAGVENTRVLPRMVYVDASRPEWVEGFTRNTFAAMVEGVGPAALDSGMMDQESWSRGIADLYRTAEPDGTFCYTFFKAVGCKGSEEALRRGGGRAT